MRRSRHRFTLGEFVDELVEVADFPHERLGDVPDTNAADGALNFSSRGVQCGCLGEECLEVLFGYCDVAPRRSAAMGGSRHSELNVRSEQQNSAPGRAAASDNSPKGLSADRVRGHSVEKHPRASSPMSDFLLAGVIAGLPSAKRSEVNPVHPPHTHRNRPLLNHWSYGEAVSVPAYLPLEEVVERYRNQVSEGTLRNWRSKRIGPSFIKIGKAILYPIEELKRWDRSNLISCKRMSTASFGANDTEGEID